MRLRLRIERNALPPTQALWPIQNPKATIAQLLQTINETFPLEADTWGLEDYSVSVGGYECLHYHEIRAVCRDEDEVVIQPLGWGDLKARRVTGRMQIAGDGRHLVDGVPYGRPAIRAPVRPEVVIPPRKKRRLGHEEEGEEPEEERLLLKERGEELEQEDDEDDEEEDEDFEESSSEEEVSAEEENDNTDEATSSSEDDSTDTSNSDSEDAESWNGLSNSEPPTSLKPTLRDQATTAAGELETPPQGAKRKRSSNDDPAMDAKTNHAVGDSEPTGLPYEGKATTKSRNARRRDAKRLKYLKEQTGFPADATIADMKQWAPKGSLGTGANTAKAYVQDSLMPDVTSTGAEEPSSDSAPSVEGIAERKEPIAHGPKAGTHKKRKMNNAPEAESKVEDSDFESRRQKLLSAIQSGGVDVSEASIKPISDASIEPSPTPPAATPRARLNLASSQRLVFGSLGVRVPETQQERDALQKKLADRPKRNAKLEQVDSPQANGDTIAAPAPPAADDIDSEAWRSRIHLTAVECCDEGVTLSTPPFPFHQRWDPQQKRKGKNSKAKSASYMADPSPVGKKRKRGQADQQQEYFETYDKYNKNGNGDALDYDGEEGDEDEEYWEDGALLNGDDDAADEEESDDGFPELPSDIDSLPLLEAHEAKVDDFITFAELACDESTEWQPKTAIRTARILSVPAKNTDDPLGEFTLLLSKRDRLPKVFDEEGNRVYSKFEMPGMDDEEEEDGNEEQEGTRRVEWQDLGPVKLISRRGAGW